MTTMRSGIIGERENTNGDERRIVGSLFGTFVLALDFYTFCFLIIEHHRWRRRMTRRSESHANQAWGLSVTCVWLYSPRPFRQLWCCWMSTWVKLKSTLTASNRRDRSLIWMRWEKLRMADSTILTRLNGRPLLKSWDQAAVICCLFCPLTSAQTTCSAFSSKACQLRLKWTTRWQCLFFTPTHEWRNGSSMAMWLTMRQTTTTDLTPSGCPFSRLCTSRSLFMIRRNRLIWSCWPVRCLLSIMTRLSRSATIWSSMLSSVATLTRSARLVSEWEISLKVLTKS